LSCLGFAEPFVSTKRVRKRLSKVSSLLPFEYSLENLFRLPWACLAGPLLMPRNSWFRFGSSCPALKRQGRWVPTYLIGAALENLKERSSLEKSPWEGSFFSGFNV